MYIRIKTTERKILKVIIKDYKIKQLITYKTKVENQIN